MRSIVLLFFRLFSFLFFGSNALEYSNRWTVQIDGHSGEAERLARKHGFVNQGNTAKSGFLNKVKNSTHKNLTLIKIFFH